MRSDVLARLNGDQGRARRPGRDRAHASAERVLDLCGPRERFGRSARFCILNRPTSWTTATTWALREAASSARCWSGSSTPTILIPADAAVVIGADMRAGRVARSYSPATPNSVDSSGSFRPRSAERAAAGPTGRVFAVLLIRRSQVRILPGALPRMDVIARFACPRDPFDTDRPCPKWVPSAGLPGPRSECSPPAPAMRTRPPVGLLHEAPPRLGSARPSSANSMTSSSRGPVPLRSTGLCRRGCGSATVASRRKFWVKMTTNLQACAILGYETSGSE
jgi:hypothetical protein